MKKIIVFSILMFLVSLTFFSCTDSSTNNEPSISCNVTGSVFDYNNGNSLSNVTVSIGNTTVATDTSGYFILKNIDYTDAVLSLQKDNYESDSREITLISNETISIGNIGIIKISTDSISGDTGGTIDFKNGEVIFAPNTFVDETGSAYNGSVKIDLITSHKNSSHFQSAFPGGKFKAEDLNGSITDINPIGIVKFEANSIDRAQLSIRTGSTTTINIDPTKGNRIESVKMFYFNKEKRIFIEDTTSVNDRGVLKTMVRKTGMWLFARKINSNNLCLVKGRVLNQDNNPIANIIVGLKSQNYITTFFNQSTTNGAGEFEVKGIKNSNGDISVFDVNKTYNFPITLNTDSIQDAGILKIVQGNTNKANKIAQRGFQLLHDKLDSLNDIPDPQTGDDIFSQAVYNTIKAKFDSSVTFDPRNPMAHLGLGILEIAGINYDSNLWDFYHDADSTFGDGRILKNQLTFLAKTPKLYEKFMKNSLKDSRSAVTFGRLQNLIGTSILPRLENAISHVNQAVYLVGDGIIINTGEEEVEIDCGEIYVYRASLYAISAAFRTLTLYDMEMTDANGNYSWMDNFYDTEYDDDYDYYNVYTTPTGQRILQLKTYYDKNSVKNDSIVFNVLKYNMNRNDFLAFRNNETSTLIKQDLQYMLNDIENSVTYIEEESDDQENDIIKQQTIVDFNEEISNHAPSDPNFVQNWNNIHDVINWLQSVLEEPYVFNEDEKSVKINFSRLFEPGLDNMKNYIPYHQWKPISEWISLELDYTYTFFNNGNDYTFYFDGNPVTIVNIDSVKESSYDFHIEPAILTNGPSANAQEIGDGETPYFPDYTFNGIFPDLIDRDKFLEVFGN